MEDNLVATAFLRMAPDPTWANLTGFVPDRLEVLADEMRLVQDLGLDSLSLTEMAFVLDDMFELSIETRDVFGVMTVGDLKAFLKARVEKQ